MEWVPMIVLFSLGLVFFTTLSLLEFKTRQKNTDMHYGLREIKARVTSPKYEYDIKRFLTHPGFKIEKEYILCMTSLGWEVFSVNFNDNSSFITMLRLADKEKIEVVDF